ncbi:MAG: hypothetical protein WBV94_08055 [Blastocatellia bacterium]
MALDPIKLDDLTWNEMVVAIRRRIAAASGGQWTLHAPVDPGITMLELFAWMLEQRVYWIDQVPDSLVRGAFSLLGEAPKPTQAAATVIRFDTPNQPKVVGRMEELQLFKSNPPIIFSTESEVALLPFEPLDQNNDRLSLFINGLNRTTDLEQGKVMRLFPANGKASEVRIVLPLRAPLPQSIAGKLFSLLFDLRDTSSIVPQWSPGAPSNVPPPANIKWFYKGADDNPIQFDEKEIDDGTGGLRRSGLVKLPIKNDWQSETLAASPGTHLYTLWMRVEQTSFTAPPRLERLIPNVTIASHKRETDEHALLREWRPLPGNVISLADLPEREALKKDYPPIENTVTLKIKERDGKEHIWRYTADLSFHGPTDRVFTVDRERGEVRFGDGQTGRLPVLAAVFKITEKSLEALKEAGVADSLLDKLKILKDGEFLGKRAFFGALITVIGLDQLNEFKALILKHAEGEPQLKVKYCVGGGIAGWLGANLKWKGEDLCAVNVVRTEGGEEPEAISLARERIASTLKQRTRAVTAKDYEEIALAIPGVAIRRAHAAIGFHPAHPCSPVPGAVTLFIVPVAPRPDKLSEDSEEFDEKLVESAFVPAPVPDPGALFAVRARLNETRLIASEVFVSAPRYRQVLLSIEIESNVADRTKLSMRIKQRLRTFLDPLIGGDTGEGWPFGEPLRPSAILREAQRIIGDQGMVIEVFIELVDASKPGKLLNGLRDQIYHDCATLQRIGQGPGENCAAITLGSSEEAKLRGDCSHLILQNAPINREPTCFDVTIGPHDLVELLHLTLNFHSARGSQGGLR